MGESATRRHFAWLLTGLAATVFVASVAWADIYHYVDRHGEHHFTTYRMSGMELIEVTRSPSGSSGGGSHSGNPSGTPSNNTRRDRSEREAQFDDIIREASEHYEIPFEFIKAVIRAESAFNPRAVSRAGAQGLMQLMPGTAEWLGVSDSFDPRQNIMGGTQYLRFLADRFNGDINLVLSGYNAGPGAVESHGGIPFEATRRYVQTVYRHYQEYLAD